jgi:hypothetical protein
MNSIQLMKPYGVRRWLAVALFALVVVFGLPADDLRAQENCTFTCTGGTWDAATMTCSGTVSGGCETCDKVCLAPVEKG